MRKSKIQALKGAFVIKKAPGFFVAKRSETEEELDPTVEWTWDVRKAKGSKDERTMENFIRSHKLSGCAVFWTGSPEVLARIRAGRR